MKLGFRLVDVSDKVMTQLKKVNDHDKIWICTIVRLYNVGLNVKDQKDDYYDYLVSYIYDNNEYLQLTMRLFNNMTECFFLRSFYFAIGRIFQIGVFIMMKKETI